MSARDDIAAHFTSDTLANQLLDAYRAEVLAKAGVEYEDCSVCGAAFSLGKSCGTCDFRARMAAEAGEKAIAPAATATPFFQPGHTYAHGDYRFRCEYLVTHPTHGDLAAWGWFGKDGAGWRHASFSERQYAVRAWTDTTNDTTTGDPA